MRPSSRHKPAQDSPRTLVIDQEVDLLRLHAANPRRYPFLLQSVLHGTPQARYDILFAFPGEALTLRADGRLSGRLRPRAGDDFLDNLDRWWEEERHDRGAETDLPFSGGWFIYLGYELAGQVEPRLSLPLGNGGDALPVACAVRVPAAFIVDRHRHVTTLLAESGQAGLLEAMAGDLRQAPSCLPEDARRPLLASPLEEDDPARYLRGVRRVKDYIRAGDVFQVNLSREWRGALREGVLPARVYQRLRSSNPAPFAGLCMLGDSAIISSSPERLVRARGGLIETRPIAGTAPRNGGQEEQGGGIEERLLAHPKERAEHVMLIDLERNDLGRVCRPGSIEVNELLVLESYAHVHHLVSNVRGRLRGGVRPGQVMRAVFPGGTITGCPKVRCMEIIAELERQPRQAYTGSMGFLNHDGGMDLNILIRTLIQEGERIRLRAGAGIVADSIPDRELEETRAKARGMLLALR